MNTAQWIILVLGGLGLLTIVAMNVLAFIIYRDIEAWDTFEDFRRGARDKAVEDAFIDTVEATRPGLSLREAIFKLGAAGVRKAYLDSLELVAVQPEKEPEWRQAGPRQGRRKGRGDTRYGN